MKVDRHLKFSNCKKGLDRRKSRSRYFRQFPFQKVWFLDNSNFLEPWLGKPSNENTGNMLVIHQTVPKLFLVHCNILRKKNGNVPNIPKNITYVICHLCHVRWYIWWWQWVGVYGSINKHETVIKRCIRANSKFVISATLTP